MTTYQPLIDGFLNIHNLNINDVVKDFMRVGDDSTGGKRQFKLLMGDDVPFPKHVDRCVCDHKIIHNCFIANRENGKVIILGKCCVRRFKGTLNRRCDICNKQHKNRSDNLCNECRLLKECTRCLNNYNKKEFYDDVCDYCAEELFLEKQRLEQIKKNNRKEKETEKNKRKEKERKIYYKKIENDKKKIENDKKKIEKDKKKIENDKKKIELKQNNNNCNCVNVKYSLVMSNKYICMVCYKFKLI